MLKGFLQRPVWAGLTNRLTRSSPGCGAILAISESCRYSVWVWVSVSWAFAFLHMARCPSARLNLLSIPLMVARDRNFVSLKVKCHKFLCLVQLWHCIGTPQANRAICLAAGSSTPPTNDPLHRRGFRFAFGCGILPALASHRIAYPKWPEIPAAKIPIPRSCDI